VRAAWELELQSHGLVSTISARRIAVARAASEPRVAAVWTRWKERDETLVQARLNAARDPSASSSAALAAAERKFDSAERALAHAIGAAGAPLDRARTQLGPVLAALPADTMLVSYVEVDSSRPADLERTHADLPGRVYAFVGQRGKAPMLIDLGPRPLLQAAVQRWLALIVDRHADSEQRRAAGQHARELIWDPIGTHAPQRRALIVTSPSLDRVPFAALSAPDGRYLVEAGYAVHLLDHESDALAPPRTTPGSPARAATLTLIGAPDFSADGGASAAGTRGICSGLRGAVFAPLPQAAREIDELRGLWTQGAVPAPLVLAGRDASEARARAAMPQSTIVHFATHGIYLGEQCQAAPPADSRGLETVDTTAPAQDTPDVAALVLSGANRAAADAVDDGLLTSEEIAAVDMTATDWAVLSACDSGIGKSVGGEGVFGLRRAFRLAGVHSVVMSLWPVDDRASADWMVALYRARLQQHATTMDAVRAADLALIAARRDAGLDPAPFYWAAFVAAGDWR
jgi:CHAT domain-containing protein